MSEISSVDIAANHPCFTGHFPGFPVLPAVAQFDLLAEMLTTMHGRRCIIEAVPSAKFLHPVGPDVTLTIEIELTGASEATFVLRSDGETVAKGSLRYRLVAS